jgi:hypothetical protein
MKNSISNGGLFQLVARLYRYTGNSEYKDWAEKIWNWSLNSPLVDNQTWNVADSTEMQDGCTSQGNTQYSYNYGTYLMGCAFMYNSVGIPFCRATLHSANWRFFRQRAPNRSNGQLQSTGLQIKPWRPSSRNSTVT